MDQRKAILDSYIEYGLMSKYKDQNTVTNQLGDYIFNGNAGAITRDNGYRTLFQTALDPQFVYSLTGQDVFGYVSKVLDNISKRDYIYDQCRQLYRNKGINILGGALSTSLSGNFGLFLDPSKMIGIVTIQDMQNFMFFVTKGQMTVLNDGLGMQAAQVLSKQFDKEIYEEKQAYYGDQSSSGSQRR